MEKENLEQQLATLQAERDRLREWLNDAASVLGSCDLDGVAGRAKDLIAHLAKRADAAESQLAEAKEGIQSANHAANCLAERLAEARKVLKATLTSIEKFCEALAKSNNQVCVEAVAEITSCAINLKAALSQPTNPPAVQSEEEIAEVLAKWSSEGNLTLMEHPPIERESLLAAARAVLALLKGE